MELQFLGTAAAEGIPAFFCNCDICENARVKGGKEIRTRSQAIIDGKLLVDFPADTYMHMLNNNLRLMDIEGVIVTHSHSDHYYPEDLYMRHNWFTHGVSGSLPVYGNDKVYEGFKRTCDNTDRLAFHVIEPFITYDVSSYKITPLLALHDRSEKCYIYIISDGKKTILYGNDTGIFPDSTWAYLKDSGITFDLVSLDCTCMSMPDGGNHMGLVDTVKVKERLLQIGCTRPDTQYFVHHFSHNGLWTHEQISEHAAKQGFSATYDGLTVSL